MQGAGDVGPLEEATVPDAQDLALLFAHHPVPMWIYDLTTLRFLEVNEAAIEKYGYSRDEFLAMRTTDIRPEADAPAFMRKVAALRTDRRITGPWRHRRRDGTYIHVDVTAHRIALGGRDAALVLAQDVTERQRAEDELRRSEERYRQLFENARDIVFTIDFKGKLLSVNRAGEEVCGYSREDVNWLNIRDLLPPEQIAHAFEVLRDKRGRQAGSMHEFDLMTRDGRRVPIELSTHLILQDGRPVGIQGIARDVTARRGFEERLRYQASHDTLTGLASRSLLQERLEGKLVEARRTREPLALVLMDLDRFKEVNDTFGHHYGDTLLRQLGPRLQRVVRMSDTMARLGGDEFAAILPGTNAEGAVGVARKLLGALDLPFDVEGRQLSIDASIGIALFPSHGIDSNTLLRRADVAMYMAKRARSGHALYDAEKDENSPDRLALVGGLRHAIEHGELVLHYQPEVDLRSGRATRLEALVRWVHPERGVIPPSDFVSLAEETGLIGPLTLWVAKHALRQCYLWRKGRREVSVSINLSAQSLYDPLLVDQLTSCMRSAGVSPNWFEVEVTESAVMADVARSQELLSRLHDMGVRISIDDFGTGYSSLAYLKRLPVDEIKIDRSFVAELARSESDAVIVRSVIDLGHNLGLEVVAEGVEDQRSLQMLSAMGCDMAQGFYLGRPMTAEELTHWYEGSPRTRAAS